MTDAAAVGTLRAVFRAEIEGHRALLAVLMAEQDALRTANAEAVAVAASSKMRHVTELETLARQRTELMIGLGMAFTPGDVETGAMEPKFAAQVKSDWATLRGIAAEAREQNALNGRLIARQQRQCESALTTLMQASGRSPVYGADGRAERDLPARPLVTI
jgi:flagellar biosynthesis/type III secretory pathway chaperone